MALIQKVYPFIKSYFQLCHNIVQTQCPAFKILIFMTLRFMTLNKVSIFLTKGVKFFVKYICR